VRQPVERFLLTGPGSQNLSLYFNRLCKGIDEPREQDRKNETIQKMMSGFSEEAFRLYRQAFDVWRKFLASDSKASCFEMACSTPLIVGKGDHSVHEFGISLQPPWAAPVIPGSGIKGVLSAWAHENGSNDWQKSVWSEVGGNHAILMFGGLDSDRRLKAGVLDFLDAWWVPRTKNPFKIDIINVHYRSYYQGNSPNWPDGTDSPVPNKFIVVQPGERFLFALRGPADWRELAKRMLVQAAGEKGFGGKTRVGYGLLDYCKSSAEWIAEIPNMNAHQLSKLYEKEKSNADLQVAFAAESQKRTMNEDLRDLFTKYRPAAALLADLKAQNDCKFKDAKTIRDRYSKVLPNTSIDATDSDIQAIFEYCLPLAPQGKPEGTWLAAFQYGAEHLLKGLSADGISELIMGYERNFPHLESFENAIEERTDLTAKEKADCLEWLSEKIKERDHR
jgi:CRISPR-associated protein Cmr6